MVWCCAKEYGSASATPPTRGNGRVVVTGRGWSCDGGAMTAGMFGALQSTKGDGVVHEVLRTACGCGMDGGVCVVVVVMTLLWTWVNGPKM